MNEVFLITLLDWMILHLLGLSSQLLTYRAFFNRRHSLIVWALYFGIRSVIRSAANAALSTGLMSPTLIAADVFFIVFTAVMNFVVLWYTWEGEPLKICLVGLLSDMMCSIGMVLGYSIMNLIKGVGFTPNSTTLGPIDMIAVDIMGISIVIILLRVLRPVIRWFKTVEFHKRKLLTIGVIVTISLFSTTNLTDSKGLYSTVAVVCFSTGMLLVPMVVYILKSIEIKRTRRVLLRQRTEMTSAFIIAMDQQTESLTEYRQILEAIRARIESTETAMNHEKLGAYVQQLREYADELGTGLYNDDIALDAILSYYGSCFNERGFDVSINAGPFECKDIKIAEITWNIMHWLEGKTNIRYGNGNSDKTVHYPETKSDVKRISYSIIKRGNQIIYSLEINWMKHPAFPKRMLAMYLAEGDVVSEKYNGNVYELDIMTEVA